MSEQEFKPRPTDERDELRKLREQLAKKEQEVATNESWGKYDVTAPNEGELTYQQYMDKQAGDGTVRDGEGYRNASNGQFASEEQYLAGVNAESADSYYDRLMDGDGTSTEAKSYSDMGLLELAKAAAAAEDYGDTAGSNEIQEIAEQKINARAEDEEWSEAQRQEAIDAFINRVMRFTGQPESAQKINATTADTDDSNPDADDGNTLHTPDSQGDVIPDVTDDDLLDAPNVNGTNIPDVTDTDLLDSPSVIEEDKSTETGDDSEESEEKKSIWKRAMQKSRRLYDKAQVLFGHTLIAMGSKFPEPKQRYTEGETIEQFERRVKRYGLIKMVGTVAVILAAKYGLHEIFESHGGGGHNPILDHSGRQGIFEGGASANHVDAAGSTDAAGNNVLGGHGSNGSELFSAGARQVTKGEGWDHTFDQMHIPKSEQPELLKQLLTTKDKDIRDWVYVMPNGDPGIPQTGEIPENVLESINKLR